eukprot:5673581-Prymnesium_polylepis.1
MSVSSNFSLHQLMRACAYVSSRQSDSRANTSAQFIEPTGRDLDARPEGVSTHGTGVLALRQSKRPDLGCLRMVHPFDLVLVEQPRLVQDLDSCDFLLRKATAGDELQIPRTFPAPTVWSK